MKYESMKETLAENPQMMGFMFAVLLLVAEMGNVAAAGSSYAGP